MLKVRKICLSAAPEHRVTHTSLMFFSIASMHVQTGFWSRPHTRQIFMFQN